MDGRSNCHTVARVPAGGPGRTLWRYGVSTAPSPYHPTLGSPARAMATSASEYSKSRSLPAR